MRIDPTTKYKPFTPVNLPDRQWPGRVVDAAPIWCSVDLRDGNQALIDPMGPERKLKMWDLLVAMGFKEIEVGFPAASQTDFDFLRLLIDEKRIPDDVTIQVLTQSRDELIRRTFDAVSGAKNVIVHLYNSTSTLQRRVVFGKDEQGVIDIAVEGARLIRELSEARPEGPVVHQYSPESFTGTELDFAVRICEAVMDVWQASPERRVILNLPATVEMATPNVYADQIEWFCRKLKNRDAAIISIHPHNDRGTGVAAAELAMMAGAERVEGTLFGNGERTGNVDVVTLAMNLFSQGVDPKLDCSNMARLVAVSEECTNIAVHPRHPYAGELVFTAFSGSHQDAINKGLVALKKANSPVWEVPYLPIDPADVGRTYEAVIRINSQSGKGGIAHVLERDHGFQLPRSLQVEFSKVVQKIADQTGRELTSGEIFAAFDETYLQPAPGGWELVEYRTTPAGRGSPIRKLSAVIRRGTEEREIGGSGNGPIDAFVHALAAAGIDGRYNVTEYNEHAIGTGADAMAVAYVRLADRDGNAVHGVGRDSNITEASLKAVLGAMNRVG